MLENEYLRFTVALLTLLLSLVAMPIQIVAAVLAIIYGQWSIFAVLVPTIVVAATLFYYSAMWFIDAA